MITPKNIKTKKKPQDYRGFNSYSKKSNKHLVMIVVKCLYRSWKLFLHLQYVS